MGRTNANLRILAATASIQWNVADILEAKADEMESVRDWIMSSVEASIFTNPEDIVLRSGSFHKQLIEILEGMTKMEQGLARHMQLLAEEEDEGLGSSFGNLFPLGNET